MTHWILERMVYEMKTVSGLEPLDCGTRISSSDAPPGVWIVGGEVKVKKDDTFQMKTRCVELNEYLDRLAKRPNRSLSIHPPVIYGPVFPKRH